VQRCARRMMPPSTVTRGSIPTIITSLAGAMLVEIKGESAPKGPRVARLKVILRAPGDQDTCIRLPGQGVMSTPDACGLGGEEWRGA
jgi:hypothetical protein